MGTINHNAIVATTWSEGVYQGVLDWLRENEIGNHFIAFTSKTLQTFSIVQPPDGSKEGWGESEAGNALRDRFVARMKEDEYEDGPSPWSWVEVGFGDFGQAILRGNNDNKFDDYVYSGMRPNG